MNRRRVFIDSSVLIAASLSRTGYARDLVLLGIEHPVELITSSYVLGETRRNLTKKSIRAIPDFEAFIALGIFAVRNPPSRLIHEVAELIEPKDAPIIAGALAARCGLIATFDRKHLLSEAEQIHRFWDLVVEKPGAIISRLDLQRPG
ncbi:MAG TPA: PIN domain-containing protein [Thermomicrobiales bacterium]|nr:PIN domain-containing protein [Thermomicrobiales bacterium]